MPRPNVRDERKAQILLVARDIFTRQSFDTVKMKEIARQANLSVGGVYWYFKSKEEILATLLLQNAEGNIALMQKRLIETDTSSATRLQIVLEQVAEQVSSMSQLYLNGAKYHAMLSRDHTTRAIIDRIGESYHAGLTALIEQGITCGEFRPVNAHELAVALIGMYEGAILLWVMSPQTMRLRESLKTAVSVILDGLTCVQSNA